MFGHCQLNYLSEVFMWKVILIVIGHICGVNQVNMQSIMHYFSHFLQNVEKNWSHFTYASS